MIPSSEIEAAKDRLRIPELWRILNLAGQPPMRDGVKFSSPLRPDAHPSCTFFDDGRRMNDWSTGKSYDGIDFLGEALGSSKGEAIRRFLEIANGRPINIEPAPIIQQQPKAKAIGPRLTGLRKATPNGLQQIAVSRNISVSAVELAQDLGTLRVGKVCGFLSWVILDQSGRCAEARRLNPNRPGNQNRQGPAQRAKGAHTTRQPKGLAGWHSAGEGISPVY